MTIRIFMAIVTFVAWAFLSFSTGALFATGRFWPGLVCMAAALFCGWIIPDYLTKD